VASCRTSFYTHLPPFPPQHPTKRTFCLLPSTTHPLWPFWKPVTFDVNKTEDEVASHLGMFNPRSVKAVHEAMDGVDEEGQTERDIDMD
jgi:hypothetical protein